MDGEREAQLIALCCSDSPEGTHRWTLRLLASRFVELSDLDSISPETVRQVLKNTIKPWQRKEWCIPAQENARFVCANGGYSDPVQARLRQTLSDCLYG